MSKSPESVTAEMTPATQPPARVSTSSLSTPPATEIGSVSQFPLFTRFQSEVPPSASAIQYSLPSSESSSIWFAVTPALQVKEVAPRWPAASEYAPPSKSAVLVNEVVVRALADGSRRSKKVRAAVADANARWHA